MGFVYHNANPLGREVNDCTIRAISLATNSTWDQTYQKLSEFARSQAIMPDEVQYIDQYLERNFLKLCGCKNNFQITVGKFVRDHPRGIYLITMSGHITCCIDGQIYDTFDPSDRLVWGAYLVKN